MKNHSNSLITLSLENLTFRLDGSKSPEEALTITNISNKKIIFKVKTTFPTWYYVRPNQHVLDLNESLNISIKLGENECEELLNLPDDDKKMEVFDKHKFLVQAKEINESDFSRLKALKDPSDEISKLWKQGETYDSFKLKVKFILPEHSASSKSKPVNTSASIESSLALKSAKEEPAPSHSELHKELQILRRKYDSVVEYTVQITEERDGLASQLASLETELAKERSKKKDGNASNKNSEARRASEGFPLHILFLIGLICFLIGKYFF